MKNVCSSIFVFLFCFNSSAEAGAVLRNELGAQVAQNIDWYSELNNVAGMIILNPAGLEKTADSLRGTGQSQKWKATKKSLTFTMTAADFPISGFNEDGLTMGILMQNEEAGALLEAAQFVQFNLDTASTVKDVVASTKVFRAAPQLSVRYFACDKGRNCVVIRYVNGQEHIEEAEALPILNDPKETFQLQAYRALNQSAQAGDFVSRFQLVFDAEAGRIFVRRQGQMDMAWANVHFKLLKPSTNRRAIVIESDVHGNLPGAKRWIPITADLQYRVARFSGQPETVAQSVSEYLFKSVTCVKELTPDDDI